jgi:hypothetical protein
MWSNIDGLWYCGTCNAKGDLFTLVALALGRDVRADFIDVLKSMADAFHIEYTKSPLDGRILERPSTVTIIDGEVKVDPPPEPKALAAIDWKQLFPPGTFGRTWMEALIVDDLPEEYYVWLGLQAIGLALGRECYTPDSPPIFGNLFLVLFGPTGVGKSRAIRHLMALLSEALPYDFSPDSKGVYLMPTPGSPEALVDLLSRPVYEDDDPKKHIIRHGSVRGLIMVDEYASLLAKAETGNRGLKSQLTTLYDTGGRLSTYSRGHGESVAMNPYVSFISTTQPTAIRQSLGYADLISGYMNRHVFVIGKAKRPYSMQRPVIDLEVPINELRILRSWGLQANQIAPDDDAFKAFDEFFHREIATIDFDHHPLFARVALTLRKVMLLLAANEHSRIITADIVGKALHLFEYLRSCYETVSGNVVSSASSDLADWVTSYCRTFPERRGKPGPTKREIAQYLPRRFDVKQLLETLRAVEMLGIIVPIDVKHAGAGRPTIRYVFQP